MKTFDFEIEFKLPANCPQDENLLDALFEVGLDDSVPGIASNGYLGLMVSRDADCAQDAFATAIADVERAVPGSEFISAKPDLIGITEASFELGRTRQALAKLLKNSSDAPIPVHAGKGGTLWHFDDLLTWLRDSKGYEIDDALIEVAVIARYFNFAKERTTVARLDSDQRSAIESIVQGQPIAA